eukprot:Awhi_evm1s12062
MQGYHLITDKIQFFKKIESNSVSDLRRALWIRSKVDNRVNDNDNDDIRRKWRKDSVCVG